MQLHCESHSPSRCGSRRDSCWWWSPVTHIHTRVPIEGPVGGGRLFEAILAYLHPWSHCGESCWWWSPAPCDSHSPSPCSLSPGGESCWWWWSPAPCDSHSPSPWSWSLSDESFWWGSRLLKVTLTLLPSVVWVSVVRPVDGGRLLDGALIHLHPGVGVPVMSPVGVVSPALGDSHSPSRCSLSLSGAYCWWWSPALWGSQSPSPWCWSPSDESFRWGSRLL
jgi:hypothetical protein